MIDELRKTVGGMVRRLRVEVYVRNGDSLLAVECEGRTPSMPGGGVDLSETLIEAATRELMEEAGWIADNYQIVTFNFPNVFKSTGCQWLTQAGIDEEEQHVVVCDGVKFQPDARYGSEGDSSKFNYMCVQQLANSTKKSIDNNVKIGIHYDRARYRLMVIQSLYGIDLNKPIFTAW